MRLQRLPQREAALFHPMSHPVGFVGGPQVAHPFLGWPVEAPPDFTSDSLCPSPIIRASRNSLAGMSIGEAVLASVLDEPVFSHRSTSLAGMRISLPSRKPCNSPRWYICLIFSVEEAH